MHEFSVKLSSVVPRDRVSKRNLNRLIEAGSQYSGTFQFQISLISTDEEYRRKATGIEVLRFQEIADFAKQWRVRNPTRKQINLSLILSESTPVDVNEVRRYFPPEDFRFRFRDYVETHTGQERGLRPISAARLLEIKDLFRKEGYYVSDDATPTATEQQFLLASNVTRRRELEGEGGA